jgi:hypothetical protein
MSRFGRSVDDELRSNGGPVEAGGPVMVTMKRVCDRVDPKDGWRVSGVALKN